jgi:hypothetical protein
MAPDWMAGTASQFAVYAAHGGTAARSSGAFSLDPNTFRDVENLSSRSYVCSLRFRRQLGRQCISIQHLRLGVQTMRCTV